RAERPAGDKRVRLRESVVPVAVKTEQKKTEPPVAPRNESSPKEPKEKSGLFKRFLKFIKKS
ncbi:MAG: hypothetical protein HY954_08715, partial [Deltaproteobacteria bacterium]|nr:hypothetical protein [Deltaproteobacteria bacterium]